MNLTAAVWVCSVLPAGAQSQGTAVEIIRDARASWMERLAAQEIRRYVYVRTGTLLDIRTAAGETATAELIVVGNKDREIVTAAAYRTARCAARSKQLSAEQYVMKSVAEGDRNSPSCSWGATTWGRSMRLINLPSSWVCDSICTAT